ncbi:AMP-binding protein (plasmid) [Photobacterium sp. DA100]|uniref:AMP-binding protein n=1 Tax=Photobacterium sp. DA100 TaxID=3027472 RepID=UPI00247A15BF|nr:AMP-binding protein [Photobacterium sp. DA100]WEM45157.1 AMP-binding protein [Photobacterium sp. DA100]
MPLHNEIKYASEVLAAIAHYAATQPAAIALQGCAASSTRSPMLTLTYRQLWQAIVSLQQTFETYNAGRIALRLENSLAWAIADLAAIAANKVLVPVPAFFHPAQVGHLLDEADIALLVGDWPEALLETLPDPYGEPLALSLHPELREPLILRSRITSIRQADSAFAQLPAGTRKITFTSGSTGHPKGVCLDQDLLDSVSGSLAQQLQGKNAPARHLVILPLTTLLENISGLYVPLLLGITSFILPGEQVGLTGSAQLDAARFAAAIARFRPESLVLTPALLNALCHLCQQQPTLAESLKFVAVGGAKVARPLLEHAQQLNIPVFEGYGLSECGSVVSLNTPANHQPGSVGQPLPHCSVRISEEGEVIVCGPSMLGYTRDRPLAPLGEIRTGDLGYLDAQGFLHITGRRKNVLITRFGRNVSPEWIEAEAHLHPALQQSVIVGDGCDKLAAIVGLAHGTNITTQKAAIEHAIDLLNSGLPDYARIGGIIITSSFSAQPSLLTANGRPRRDIFTRRFTAPLCQLQTQWSHAMHNIMQTKPMTLFAFSENSLMTSDVTRELTATPCFFDQLEQQTQTAREQMYQAPVFHAVGKGGISHATYTAFLTQAYHHVKHTVPLLMACGSRLPEQYEWLRQAIGEYIEEEKGHHDWILSDLDACHVDTAPVRANTGAGKVGCHIELMVAYLYYQIDRGNPLAFFGMVWVLEGTSVAAGGQMAAHIQKTLELPDQAMTYLMSHSALDQQHIQLFEVLMNRITDPADQQAIVDGANMVYRLYGEMLAQLPLGETAASATEQHSAA